MTLLDTPVSLRCGRRRTADIDDLNRGFEGESPGAVIAWAVAEFGSRLSLAASFSDTLLVDIAVAIDPDIEVVFIDTGFHFPETLATLREAMVRYGLNLTVLRPAATAADRWAHGVDTCCGTRKVAPLERHLAANADAWMSGLRRDDSETRSTTPIVELDRLGLVKLNPLVVWSSDRLDRYSIEHDVLVNPLGAQGFGSIGCWPCTEPSRGDDLRSGRWTGSAKTECGLH